jgi:hypothetical protein
MAALVVADLAQLGRNELAEPGLDLARGELVVEADRERGADADAPARTVDPPSTRSETSWHARGPGRHLLELGAQSVGLRAARGEQGLAELGGIPRGQMAVPPRRRTSRIAAGSATREGRGGMAGRP